MCISSDDCVNQLVRVSYTCDILALCPSKGSIRYKNKNKHALADLDVSSHKSAAKVKAITYQNKSQHFACRILKYTSVYMYVYNCISSI